MSRYHQLKLVKKVKKVKNCRKCLVTSPLDEPSDWAGNLLKRNRNQDISSICEELELFKTSWR